MKRRREQEGPAFTKVSAGKQEEQEKKGRLVLIDGHAILHRAYPAIIFVLLKSTGLRLVRSFKEELVV